MRTIFLFLIAISISLGLRGQTITLDSLSNPAQPYPFNFGGGYARSAAIYTAGEMGSSKFITSLGWNVNTGDFESSPIRIYLKLTTDATLIPTEWNSITTETTLVYNASASFPTDGWKTIDIADFVYLAGQNLLVLCEANYGGNGPPSYPSFACGHFQDQHEIWQHYDTPPIDSGSVNVFRPHIQISYLPLSNPNPPTGFIAQAASPTQVDLTWTRNAANNNVMVAFSATNTFGTPAGNYVPGNPITGGGTVLYNGPATGYNHNTGLNPATTYYYKAWSVLPPTPAYSTGATASATTMCVTISIFPNTIDFETSTFPPVCWSLADRPWTRNDAVSAFGIGTGSATVDFWGSSTGTSFDLISPTLDLSALANPIVSFDHAYATYSGEEDRLELWRSADNGISYTLLNAWLGGISGPLNTNGGIFISSPFVPASNEWASKSFALPAGTNKILLRGVSGNGNDLFLDNITIGFIAEPMIVWNGNISGQWHNPLNWTPTGVPIGTQDVTIATGRPNNPIVSTPGNFCRNLVINTGATLTVSVGYVLTIMANATIQNNATLTNNGSVIIKGNFTNQNTE